MSSQTFIGSFKADYYFWYNAIGVALQLFAVSRIGNDGRELLVAFNTSTTALVAQVEVETGSAVFKTLRGPCAARASAPGSVEVKLLPLSYVVCVGGPQ